MNVVKQYKKWKEENPDEDYQYDMIHDFISELSRFEIIDLCESAELYNDSKRHVSND